MMPEPTMPGQANATVKAAASGRVIVLAGGTSVAGRTIARALLHAGARVVTVGSRQSRLDEVAAELPGIHTALCDLTSETDVSALAERVRGAHGHVDGLIPLVGGWRGGGGLAGQSDADYRALEISLTALRHTSRAFDADLRASDAGRLAIVSSTTLGHPLAGTANYAAIKAAAEAWTRAVGQGYAKHARDTGAPLAAAVIYRATKLEGMEETLADAVLDLWEKDPADLNGTTITLATHS